MSKPLRILVCGDRVEYWRDLLARDGDEVWACNNGVDPSRPGLYYNGSPLDLAGGYTPVRFSGECDPDGSGVCQLSGNDVGECPCVGPTQEDEVEYVERSGVVFGRPKAHPKWDFVLIASGDVLVAQ